ncbi:hypothetical protein FQA39_LY09363 [Lamprigera yunnana]|nr:hypothetical protein FQA39_LY09363 [Lamprigera yunnana]
MALGCDEIIKAGKEEKKMTIEPGKRDDIGVSIIIDVQGVCLIESESGKDTAQVTEKADGSKNLGLFQINSKKWCRFGQKGGDCNIKCEDLLDEHIHDDSICVKKVYNHVGFQGWHGWATKYMNTYKVVADKPFQVAKVQQILNDVLKEALENLTYDPEKCARLAKWASAVIKDRVKAENYDRYRFVITVSIGEKNSQDVCCVLSFLWDLERDKYVVCTKENNTVFAIALCFGVYYE